jgi:hypothetical protein
VLDAGLSALAVEPLRETGHAAVIGVHLAVHDLSMLAITNSDPRSAGGATIIITVLKTTTLSGE